MSITDTEWLEKKGVILIGEDLYEFCQLVRSHLVVCFGQPHEVEEEHARKEALIEMGFGYKIGVK